MEEEVKVKDEGKTTETTSHVINSVTVPRNDDDEKKRKIDLESLEKIRCEKEEKDKKDLEVVKRTLETNPLPVETLRQRMQARKEAKQKTVLDLLHIFGVEDSTAFVWTFVSALIVFYMSAPGLFIFGGVCIFAAWFWKNMSPPKELFVGVFAAFVFFSVFSTVFNVRPQPFGRMHMRGPVSTFNCHEVEDGKFMCQFTPQQQQPQQTRQYQDRRHWRNRRGRKKPKTK